VEQVFVNSIVSSAWVLFAADQPQGSPVASMLPLVAFGIIMLLYIFIVQRPNMRREQEARNALKQNLKKNDRILTTSGIYGVVTNVQSDADEVTIRVDDATGAKLRITLSAVQRVLSDSAEGGKGSKADN
jgi:preprotein translocase subunit YajC